MKKNKMTYAQVADKLTKKIGELEEKAKSSDRFARETAKTMLPRYQEKLDALYNAQEQSKQADMQKDIQSFQMKWGGQLPQYGFGANLVDGINAGSQKLFGMDMTQGGPGMILHQGLMNQGDGKMGMNLLGGLMGGQQPAMPSDQMAYGGQLPQYNVGGDIGAGVAGFIGGLAGSIPIVGDPLQQMVYGLHEKIDGDVSDQEKSIRAYGAAAGGLGAGIATGNPMAAMGAMGDLKEGYMYGQSDNPMGYAYGGGLPKMNDGGEPPLPGETWGQYRMRVEGSGGEMLSPAMFNQAILDAGSEMAVKPGEQWQDYMNRVPTANPSYFNAMMADPNNNRQLNVSATQIRPGEFKPDLTNPNNARIKEFQETGTLNDDGSYSKIFATDTPSTQDGFGVQGPGASDDGSGQGGAGTSTWQDLLYKGAAYSPTAYNFARGLQKPQVLEAEDFQNPYESDAMRLMANRRFNIDPQLQANRSTFNQMRGGLKNVSGGNAATYLSNMGQLQMNKGKMDEQAYAMKQNMDNQYKAQDAQFRGNMGNIRAQRELQIQDINDRNKAARDAYMGKGFEGLSKIAQNEKYMGNLSGADQQRIALLQQMPWNFVPQFDENNMMTGYKYMGV